jgi:hypothetical protein
MITTHAGHLQTRHLHPRRNSVFSHFTQQNCECSSGKSIQSMGKSCQLYIPFMHGEKKRIQKLTACVRITVHAHLVLMKQLLNRCSKPLTVVPTDPVMLMVKNLISHKQLCGEWLQLQLLQHITEYDKYLLNFCGMLDRSFHDKNPSNQDFYSYETTVYTSTSINEHKFQVQGRKLI